MNDQEHVYPSRLPLDTVRSLHGEGASVLDIARQCGVTPNYVRIRGRQAGVEWPYGPYGRPRSKALSRTVVRAIVLEAQRRGGTVLEVLADLNAHGWDGEV